MNKKKKRLSNFDFSNKGAHIALCSKEQGAANNHNQALIIKSMKFTQEEINKMQQVRVTMELPDFLEKFFYVWGEQADLLAALMGYDETQAEMEEAKDEQSYIKEKLKQFEVLKNLHEGPIHEVIDGLDAQTYMELLEDQEVLEGLFDKIEKKKQAEEKLKTLKEATQKAVEKTIKKQEVKPVGKAKKPVAETPVTTANQATETKMKEVKKANTHVVELEQTVQQVEMVEKSAYEEVMKQAEDMRQAIEKANAELKAFKEEKAAAIAKARKDAIKAVVGSDDATEILFKAASQVEDSEFEAYVGALKSLAVVKNNSDLFVEQGNGAEGKTVEKKSELLDIMKSKYGKKA